MSSLLTAPETLPPAPRSVHRKRGSGCGVNFLRLFILPHTLVGVGLIVAIPVTAYIRNCGQPVTATVDKLDTHRSSKGKISYYVDYHFTLDDRRYDERDSVPLDTYAYTHRGDQIAGRAGLVFNHALFFGPGAFGGPGVLALMGFALFWNGIVGIFFYTAWIAPIRQRLLVKHGAVAAGVVSGKEIIRGKGTRYKISYTFTPRNFDDQTGSCIVSRSVYDDTEPDAPCTILYDQNKPRRNLAYEFCDFRVLSG
jgi:hypothetical protein